MKKAMGKARYILICILLFFLMIPFFRQNTTSTQKESKGKMKLNSEYYGFKLIEEKTIDEIHSVVRIFEHIKSGAKLIFVQNDDENKVFSISFKTPPKDSSGAAHIVEHAVLCGSEKFPVKDPFFTIDAQSLNTFLNAATYSDKTMYPIASRNGKDFKNLMDIYLDAVFHPNFLNKKEIFMQEGINFEITSKEEEIRYNGIVYNETKGTYSSTENILYGAIQKSLFPDTCYKYDSGGRPEEIEKLTYEKFLDFYKAYYHPSNSYIYLYGDLDIKDTLKFIDEAYLHAFDKQKIDSTINLQKTFEKRKIFKEQYAISKEDDSQDKTYLALNFTVDTALNKETYLVFHILDHLMNTPSSPLTRALWDSGLGESSYTWYTASGIQPTFSIILENSSKDKAKEFEQIVTDTLQEMVKKGIDKKQLESAVNALELQTRTSKTDAERGLTYNDDIMYSWLYDGDPALYLTINEALEKMKKNIGTDYFEKMISKYLLNNQHSSLVILEPIEGMEEAKVERTKEYLAKYKESLSKEELNDLINENIKLKKRQEKPDSKKALASIPSLLLSDIDDQVEEIPMKKAEIDGVTILHTPLYTNNMAYINLYFDTRRVPKEKLSYLYLLGELLGNVRTENYDYTHLSDEIHLATNGIDFDIDNFKKFKEDEGYFPKMVVSTYCLTEKIPEVLNLIDEIIHKTRFDNRDRIKEQIFDVKSELEEEIKDGDAIVKSRLNSYYSTSSQYDEIGSLAFYQFILKVEKLLENNPKEVMKNLEEVMKLAFPKEDFIVGVTCSDEDYQKFIKTIPSFTKKVQSLSLPVQKYAFDSFTKNEGLMVASKVQYVAKGYNFSKLGYEYSGKMLVLKTILDEYLISNVRIKGGAYGAYFQFEDNGNALFMSYRDPKLRDTLEIFDHTPEMLKSFKGDKNKMKNYIIGTVGKIQPLLSPWDKGERAQSRYIEGVTQKDLQKIMDEVLSTTDEDIRIYGDMIEEMMKKNYICVLGNNEKIKENKEFFNKIVKVSNMK